MIVVRREVRPAEGIVLAAFRRLHGKFRVLHVAVFVGEHCNAVLDKFVIFPTGKHKIGFETHIFFRDDKPFKVVLMVSDDDNGSVGRVKNGSERCVEIHDDRLGFAQRIIRVVSFGAFIKQYDGTIIGAAVGLIEVDNYLANGVKGCNSIYITFVAI